jgi:hypothetical protein
MLGESICLASNSVLPMSLKQVAGEMTEDVKVEEVVVEDGILTPSPYLRLPHKL